MSKRPEESALQAYPHPDFNAFRDTETAIKANREMVRYRKYYIEGYKQAEKDLALTWQDMETIAKIFHNLVFTITADEPVENIYEEVLKRFNKYKEEEK